MLGPLMTQAAEDNENVKPLQAAASSPNVYKVEDDCIYGGSNTLLYTLFVVFFWKIQNYSDIIIREQNRTY